MDDIGFGQMVVWANSKMLCISMVEFVAQKMQCVTYLELF
jgi:hypothetical protein